MATFEVSKPFWKLSLVESNYFLFPIMELQPQADIYEHSLTSI